MITLIEPERGGEEQGILRVELSVPFSPAELIELRDWFASRGWSIETDQIDAYLNEARALSRTTLQEAVRYADRLVAEVARCERAKELLEVVADRPGKTWEATIEGLDQIIEEFEQDPLSITATVQVGYDLSYYNWTIEVLEGTGGPACGVWFVAHDDARCWWQNWFTTKEFVTLDPYTATALWDRWNLEDFADRLDNMEGS